MQFTQIHPLNPIEESLHNFPPQISECTDYQANLAKLRWKACSISQPAGWRQPEGTLTNQSITAPPHPHLHLVVTDMVGMLLLLTWEFMSDTPLLQPQALLPLAVAFPSVLSHVPLFEPQAAAAKWRGQKSTEFDIGFRKVELCACLTCAVNLPHKGRQEVDRKRKTSVEILYWASPGYWGHWG